jgi:hypothetical protein
MRRTRSAALAFLPRQSQWRFLSNSSLRNDRQKLFDHCKTTKSLGGMMLYLLGVAFRNRPLVSHLTESDLDSSTGDKPTAKWETGSHILADVWPVVSILRNLRVPQAHQKGRGMVITYGTQKGREFKRVYLAAVVGNYNLVPLLGYMDPHSINRILHDHNTTGAVVFVPSPLCARFRSVVPAFVHVVGLRLTHPTQQTDANAGGLGAGGCSQDLDGMIERLSPRERELPSATAIQDERKVPTTAAIFVPRSNSLGGTELVITPHATNFQRSVNALKGVLQFEHVGTTANVVVSPMSSGDMLTLTETVVKADRMAMLDCSLSHMEHAAAVASNRITVSTPVQYRSMIESFSLHAALLGHKTASDWWYQAMGPLLHMCASGGGTPEPVQQLWLANSPCRQATVLEAWGSYEMLDITYTINGVARFNDNVLAWALADVGPYKKSDGRGELLLQTKHMHKHTDKAYNSRQFVELDGQRGGPFFRTKDVVQMTSPATSYGKLSAGVKMIDKVNGPFTLANGLSVATGLVERAIEGDQSYIYNTVLFGSDKVDGTVAVVWLTRGNPMESSWQVLNSIQTRLGNNAAIHAWEVPIAVHIADEPWEYRPRHKIRWMLTRSFYSAVNKLVPGAIPPPFSLNESLSAVLPKRWLPVTQNWPVSAIAQVVQVNDHSPSQVWPVTPTSHRFVKFVGWTGQFSRFTALNVAVTHNHYLSNIVRQAADNGRKVHQWSECQEYFSEFSMLCRVEEGAPVSIQADPVAVAERFVLAAIMGCHSPDETGGSVATGKTACMIRNVDGSLREPIARHTPYDPSADMSARVGRFDDIPWQLWDLRNQASMQNVTAGQIIEQILLLHARKEEIASVVPLYLPSLGLLHDFGARFRIRVEHAHRLAVHAPHVFAESESSVVFQEVTRLCYAKWYAAAQ